MRRIALLFAALGIALGSACKDEVPSPPPRKVKKKVDTDRIPVPNHSPDKMTDPGKPRRVTMKGTMEADLSGRKQHFVFFPRGENAAVYYAETGVSWLKIRGALSDEGTPSFSMKLEPLKLDDLELPATFVAGEAKDGAPALHVEYEMGVDAVWTADALSPSENPMQDPMRVTFERFEDRTLHGTFEGTLMPKAPNTSEPVKVARGTFAIELRLTNVERGEKAEVEAEVPAKDSP